MKLYEIETNEPWPEDSTANCEERFVAKKLQNFPPRLATAVASKRSGHCLCDRNSKTVTTQKRIERGQELFEQLLCNSRKRKRLLVPDLATEWFRKQKLFLDRVSPEELQQSQLERECSELPDTVSCDCAHCGCYEPRPRNRIQYLDCYQELRRRRMLLARQRQQQRLGEPICRCTDPPNWPPFAKNKKTVKILDSKKANETSTTGITDKEQQETTDEEQEAAKQAKSEHNPFTICNPHVAGCLPGIAEKPPNKVKPQRKLRSIGGANKLECCLYPHRPCSYNRPKRRKSCACIFQADGQPMGDECLRALRMESPVLRLRKKYSLREAPHRQLDPCCYRRISPEFYSLLKNYEDGMNERYPLYGMPLRYWNRTTPCCPCEERRPSKLPEPSLGDQSLVDTIGSKEGEHKSEESAYIENMDVDGENEEYDEYVDCDDQTCKHKKTKETWSSDECIRNKCSCEVCHLTESKGTVESECSNVLAQPCTEKTCPALKQRKVLNSSSSHSSQGRKAIRIRSTNRMICVADPKASNERLCPNARRPDEQSIAADHVNQTPQPELRQSSIRPIFRPMEPGELKTVRIKCSKTSCVSRNGILGNFAKFCKRAIKPGRHLLYNFGNGCPKTYQPKERTNYTGRQTPLFSHQPKPCCWRQHKTEECEENGENGESTAAGCVPVPSAAAINVATNYATARVAAAYPAAVTPTPAPNDVATTHLAANRAAVITATKDSVKKQPISKSTTINIATNRAPKRKRPMATVGVSSLARQQSNETIKNLGIPPQSPQSLVIPQETSKASTSSSASYMGPYATLQNCVVQYLQGDCKAVTADNAAPVTRNLPVDQSKLPTEALLNASLKNVDTVATIPTNVQTRDTTATARPPDNCKHSKPLARNMRATDVPKLGSSRKYGPGADYARLMHLMARKPNRSHASRRKSSSVCFRERQSVVVKSISSESIHQGSLMSEPSNRKYSDIPLDYRPRVNQKRAFKASFVMPVDDQGAGTVNARNRMGQYNKKFTNNFVSGNHRYKRYDSPLSSQASVHRTVQRPNYENNRNKRQSFSKSSDNRNRHLRHHQQQSKHYFSDSNTTTQSSILTASYNFDQATSNQDELNESNFKTETDATDSTVSQPYRLKSQQRGAKIRNLRYSLTGNFMRPLKAISIGSSRSYMASSMILGSANLKRSRNKSIKFDENYTDNIPSCSNQQREIKRCSSGQSMAFEAVSPDTKPSKMLPVVTSELSPETSLDSIECVKECIDTVTRYSNAPEVSNLSNSSLTNSNLISEPKKPATCLGRSIFTSKPPINEKLINKAWEKKVSRHIKYCIPHVNPRYSLRTRRPPPPRVYQRSPELNRRWTPIVKKMQPNELNTRLSSYNLQTAQAKRTSSPVADKTYTNKKRKVNKWSGPNRDVNKCRSCSGCDVQFNYDQTQSNECNASSQTPVSMSEAEKSSSSHIVHVFPPGADQMAASNAKKRIYKANGYAAPCSSACVIKREYESSICPKLSQQSQTDFTCTNTDQLNKLVPYEERPCCSFYANNANKQAKLRAIYRRNTSNVAQTEILESSYEFPQNENLYEKYSMAMKTRMGQPIAFPSIYRDNKTKRTNGREKTTRLIQGTNVFANTFDKLPSSRKNFVSSDSMSVLSESFGYPPQIRHYISSSDDEQRMTDEADQKQYQQIRYPPRIPNLIKPNSILKTNSKQLKRLVKSRNDVRRVNFVSQQPSTSSLVGSEPYRHVQYNPSHNAYSVNKGHVHLSRQPGVRRPSVVPAHMVHERKDNQTIPEKPQNLTYLNPNLKQKAVDVGRTRGVQILEKNSTRTPSLFAVPTTSIRDDVFYSKDAWHPSKRLMRLPVHKKQQNELIQSPIDEENQLPMNSQLLTVNRYPKTRPPICPSRRPIPPPVSLVSELDFNTHLMEERTINPNELRKDDATAPSALTTLMNKLSSNNCKISSTSTVCRQPHVPTAKTKEDLCTRAAHNLKRLPCTPNSDYLYNNYAPHRRCALRSMPEDPLIIEPTHVGLREQQMRQSCLPLLLYGRQKRAD